MNKPVETKVPDAYPQVNEQRRRFTQGGLAAPVVLGTLLSRPVLGAAPHNCTISGQLSGNVSTHVQGDCAELGQSPSDYAGLAPSSWPNATADFLNDEGNPRQFRNTPFSFPRGSRFADAYEKEKIDGDATPPIGTINPADVRDVLAGFVTKADGTQNTNWVLRAKLGFNSDIALGQEAVAAYMNAWDVANSPNYPLTTPATAVAMFNAVVDGGRYDPTGVNWDASQVLAYFKSLHT